MHEQGKTPALIKLGFFLGLSNLAHIAIGVTDVFMAGWLGPAILAAATLIATFFHLIILITIGFVVGVSPLLAKALGAGDTTAFQKNLAAMCQVLLIFLIPALLIMLFAEPALDILGQPAGLITIGSPYLLLLTATLPFSILFAFFWIFTSIHGLGRLLFWVSILSLLLNAAGNYIFMFGWGPLPAMGISGLGLSTMMSAIIKTLVLVFFLLNKNLLASIPWKEIISRFHLDQIKQVLRYGLPMAFLECATMSFFAALVLMAGSLGALPLATFSLTLQLAEIGTGLSFGFSEAATIVIAYFIGAKDPQNRDKSLRHALVSGMGSMICYAGILLLWGQEILAFFLNESDPSSQTVLKNTEIILVIASVCLIVDSGRIVTVGILRGLGDNSYPIYGTLICFWGLSIPAAYILGISLAQAVAGLWAGMALGMGAASLLLFGRLRYFSNATRKLQ